ncbi:unnamed protein product [Paramecium octaurelia]|uniref:Uncharacterized protein n=1 Tax=Paramecium octaurelia TaxID=43137 RepID=A0A8S1VQF1_PAROT|nr:unnamed protein product [Paramecium octaurelia]
MNEKLGNMELVNENITDKQNYLDLEALLMFGCLQLNYQEYEQMIHLP